VLLGRLRVEVQAVGEAAAPAALDADAEDGPLGQVLLGDDLLDLVGGLLAKGHTHRMNLLTREGLSRTGGRPADARPFPSPNAPANPSLPPALVNRCARTQPRDRRRHVPGREVDLVLRVEPTDPEPKAGAGEGLGKPQGGQDVARTGLGRAAGR